MKPGEVLGHSPHFPMLNLSKFSIENNISSRIQMITTDPSTTIQVLNEIRDLTFYANFKELELVRKNFAPLILNVFTKLDSMTRTPEISDFRKQLLEILTLLDFHFLTQSISPEFLNSFFKLITDGTMDEMTTAVKFLRHAFESVDNSVKNPSYLLLAQHTLSAAEIRLRWLMDNPKSADYSTFFPFSTLLIVLNFCSNTWQAQLKEPVTKLLHSTEQFLLNTDFSQKSFRSYLPLIALKFKLTHFLTGLIDSISRDKQFGFVLDSYIHLFNSFPISYQSLADDFIQCFPKYATQKFDDDRMERIIKTLPNFTKIPIGKPDFFCTSLKVLGPLSVSILQYPQLPNSVFEQLVHYSTTMLHYSDVHLILRTGQFTKLTTDLLSKIFTGLDGQSRESLFQILYNINYSFQIIGEMQIDSDPKKLATEMKKSIDFMRDMAYLADSYSKIIELFAKTIKAITQFQNRFDKIQDGTNASVINQIQQLQAQKLQQQQQQNDKMYLQQLYLQQKLQSQIKQKQQEQQNGNSTLGINLKNSNSITTIASLLSSISNINPASLINNNKNSTALQSRAAQAVANTQNNISAQSSSSFSQLQSMNKSSATPTTTQQQAQQTSSQQTKLKIAYPFDCNGSTLIVDTYVSAMIAFFKTRIVLHRCTIKFTLKPVTSDYVSNLKSCQNHNKYMGYYDKARALNQNGMKWLLDSLVQTKVPILFNVWDRFITAFVDSTDLVLNDLFFIQYILCRPHFFATFYHSYVRKIEIMHNKPSFITQLLHMGADVLERIIDIGTLQGDLLEAYLKLVVNDTKLLFKIIMKYFTFFSDTSDAIILLIYAPKLVSDILLPKRPASCTITPESFLNELITPELVTTICINLADWPRSLSNLFKFIGFCNNKVPHSVENETVVSILTKYATMKANHSLSVLSSILERRPDLIRNDISNEKMSFSYTRGSTLAEIAMNALIYAPESNSLDILMKFIQRATLEPIRPDSIQTHKCVLSFTKGDNLIQVDSEMFLSAFASIIEQLDDIELWDSLLYLVFNLLVDPDSFNNQNIDFKDVKNDFDNKNYIQGGYKNRFLVASKICVFVASLHRKKEKLVERFFDQFLNHTDSLYSQIKLSDDNLIKIKALVFTSIIQYSNFFKSTLLDINLFVKNESDFANFFETCIDIIETTPVPNISMKEILLIDFIMNHVSMDLINVPFLIETLIHSISISPILKHIQNSNYRDTVEFKLRELSLLPENFKEIIQKAKEMIQAQQSDLTFLLKFLTTVPSDDINWCQFLALEFLADQIEPNVIESILKDIFDSNEYQSDFLIIDLICPIFRVFPTTLSKFIDQIQPLVDKLALNKSKPLENSIERKMLQISYILLQSDEDVMNYNNLFDLIPLSAKITIPDYLALYKTKTNSDKFNETEQALTTKLNNDGIYDLKKLPSTTTKSPLSNWTNISLYWRSIFFLSKQDFTNQLIAQFCQFTDGLIEISQDKLQESYHSMCSIISNKYFVAEVLNQSKIKQESDEGNKGTLIDKIVLSFLKIFERYNSIISNDFYVPLIHFFEETGKEFYSNYIFKYLIAKRTTVVFRYILSLEEAIQLTLNIFSIKKEEILRQLALPQEIVMPTEPMITLALLSVTFDNFDSCYLPIFLDIFIRILAMKKDCFILNQFVQLITKKYNVFEPYLLRIILQTIVIRDPINFSYIKPLITLYIHSEKVTKEVLASVSFVYNSKVNHLNDYDYLTQIERIKQSHDNIVIEDDDENSLFAAYVRTVLLPFSIDNKESADFFYRSYTDNNSKKIVISSVFLNKVPEFEITSSDTFGFLQESNSDIEQDSIFNIWSQSKQNGHFTEMLCHFLDATNVHISKYAKQVFESIKIPTGNNDVDYGVDINVITDTIEETIIKFINLPSILCSLWTFLANNIEIFPNFMDRFWELIKRQIAEIRYHAKKPHIPYVALIAESFTTIFTKVLPPKGAPHDVILYFTGIITSTTKTIFDNPSSISYKQSIPLLKCILRLTRRYGDQLHGATDFFHLYIDYFTKILVQNEQAQIHQQIQQQLPSKQQMQLKQQQQYQLIQNGIFESLIIFVPKIMPTVLQFSQPLDKMDSIVDSLLHIAQTPYPALWPYALRALNYIAAADLYIDKIRKLADNFDKEDNAPYIFPLLWMNRAFAEYRTSKLLPNAIKWCNQQSSTQQQQQPQQSQPQQQQPQKHQEQLVSHFMIRADYKIMFEHPAGQTLIHLFNELNQETNKRYTSYLISTVLTTAPKSKIVTDRVQTMLHDPKICLLAANPNVIPIVSDVKVNLNLMAKIALIINHPESPYLEELMNEASTDTQTPLSVYEISRYAAEAQKVDAIDVPLTIIFSKLLPDTIIKNLPIRHLLQVMRLFRPEFKRTALDSFLHSGSYSETKFKKKMNDLKDEFMNSLQSYQSIGTTPKDSIDGVLSIVNEYLEHDLADSINLSRISQVTLFMHHGMLTPALHAAKNSLHDLSKDDLMKIRMKDAVFPNFTEEWIKDEVSSLYSSTPSRLTPISQYLEMSTDFIATAIRDLPYKSRIAFSNSLASLFLAWKLKKIDLLLKNESELHKKKTQPGNKQKQIGDFRNGIFGASGDILPQFFSSSAHKAYEELRAATYSLLKIDDGELNIEQMHSKFYHKSLYQNFIEDRPQIPPPEDIIQNSPRNFKKLIKCFSNQLSNKEWRPIFEDILIKAMKIKTNNNDLLVSLLYRLLTDGCTDELLKKLDFATFFGSLGIPLKWSQVFSEIKNQKVIEKVKPYLPLSFWPLFPDFLPPARILNARNIFNQLDIDSEKEIILLTTSFLNTPLPFAHSASYILATQLDANSTLRTSSLNFRDTVPCIHSIVPIVKRISPTALKLRMRSTRGQMVNYFVTSYSLFNSNLSILAHLISSIFDDFSDTRRRGIKLASYQSFEIKPNMFITTADALLHPTLPNHDQLVSILTDIRNKQPPTDSKWIDKQYKEVFESIPITQFLSVKELIIWKSIYSYRFAGLSSLQILLNCKLVDPQKMTINHLYAIPSVSFLQRDETIIDPIFRINGIFRCYFDDVMLNGPFKSGLVSSFLALNYKKEKLRVFLSNLISTENKETDALFDNIKQYSIAENNSDKVMNKIEHLIEESVKYHDFYDELFDYEFHKNC